MKKYLTFLFVSIIISSCSTTQRVSNDNLVQKRKYNKGFFVNGFRNRDLKNKISQARSITIDSESTLYASNNTNEDAISFDKTYLKSNKEKIHLGYWGNS